MYKINFMNRDALMNGILKTFFIMRLTIIIILIAAIQLSAKDSNGQKLTYNKNNATISEIFKEIKRQTGYNVIWYEGKLNSHMPIDVNFYNTPLDKVMDNVLDGRAVTYQIIGKAIVVKAGEPAFRDKVISTLATIDVRGRVLDENNTPLVGAVVKVKGGSASTPTNSNGEFLLKNVDENATLVISFLGYETREVNAAKNIATIKLTPSTDKLKEVEINAGYYRVTERERTGSISRVTSSTIEKQAINNPLMALQNRVPGLEITQLTGIPGGGFKVQIRGRNSVSSAIGNDPFYIVDGVPFPSIRINTQNSQAITQGVNPLSMINPNDIESIEVLKDADATAIYGSRGANGVILITTKKGSQGDVKVNANVSHGFSEVGHQLEQMNTEQYLNMRREAFKNDGLTPSATDYDLNGIWDQNKYTDWQEVFIGGKADITSAGLNISGGNKSSNYIIGGNYYNEGTVFPGDLGFKRGGAHANINFGTPESRFNASFTANYSQSTSNLTTSELTSFISYAPNAPDLYDQYGNLSWTFNNGTLILNPGAVLLGTIDATTANMVANANLSYRILKNLVLKTSMGYTTIKREELAKRPITLLNPATNPASTSRSTQFGNTFNNSWIVEPQLNYRIKLGGGSLNALAGMSFQENTAEIRNITASNFSSDEVMENIQSATTFSIPESTFTTYKYAALLARLNYNLLDKYILNVTGRRDASSKFGPGKQFANFGAIGAAWIFSEEKFLKNNLSFLSFGKLRGSYGITGNDQILDYGYLQLYLSNSSYQGSPSIITSRIANSDYGWETNKKAEVALQLGFLKDRINVEIAYFRNVSSNQLLSSPLPPSVGASSIQANLPATVLNRGWEFEASCKILNQNDWNWTLGFNLSIPKNKLVSYPDFANSGNSTLVIGQPLSVYRYYNVMVDKQTGSYTYEDRDGNGLRNDADLYLNKFLGQIFYGGLTSNVRYKQLNLDFLISFTKQTGTSVITKPGGIFTGGLGANNPTVVLDRWQKPGDQMAFPKFSTVNSSNTSLGDFGSQRFSDNSFARLKSISLSYSVPKQWLSKIKIKDVQINLQGQNVFTLTKYKGLDPENQILLRLPPLRTFMLGIKLTI
ncbi:SusC/RagA family TonB-linked outer membrane protein [Pedobacter hiemivivus]|uniref:SusC/RagA family TonB-linked outer membrane protein n=1 Tax=Pedobacter hiemivivus TaxID=2530454 RepID=A0A4U1GGG8_9SPHI|nr:SusC/RagA family TonB-linked outer membrane protein [Pedobacter hiemivivus]TKC62199.1 SusC/RagA family TonB-linked outer membrane protein [Pedobacter hiemivivus]